MLFLGGSMMNREKLIEYLSSEINTHTTNISTFRAKLSFITLVGPFLLLSSFFIATKGVFPPVTLSALSVSGILTFEGSGVRRGVGSGLSS